MNLLLALLMLLLIGCPAGAPEKENSSTEKRPLAGAELRVGDTRWKFEARDKGYRLEAGAQKLVIDVESDRVKVEDGTGKEVAKVKTKPEGFKVYGGDDNAVLRGKRRGDSYKLKRLPADEELDDADVAVEKSGEMWVVKRNGQEVAQVSASVPKHAVSFLAVTEVSFEQRIAILVHVLEVPP